MYVNIYELKTSRFLQTTSKTPFFFFFFNGAADHIGPWPPRMRFLNLTLIDSWYDSLDERSARRKAATYTGQHKHRIHAYKHPGL
jgi:hypothetical protein